MSFYPITPEREKLLRETAEQMEYAVPDLEQRVEQSNLKELLYEERTLEDPVQGHGRVLPAVGDETV